MLKRLSIDEKTYNDILLKFNNYIDYVDSLGPYLCKGYKNKKRIKAVLGDNAFICQGYVINFITNRVLVEDSWKQILCIKKNSLQSNEEIKEVKYATQINKIIDNILLKYYSLSEIDNIYKNHELDYAKPLHYEDPIRMIYNDGVIHKFYNCVYYDINGAHRDALCELFPLAKEDILNLPDKDWPNMFVGDLCNRNHRKTYYWIVNRTRNMIESILNECGGVKLYINTDGAIIINAKELPTSHKIGEFKDCFKEDILYLYSSKKPLKTPHFIMQYIDEKDRVILKGKTPATLRNNINLFEGKVVDYKAVKKDNAFIYEDVEVSNVEIVEHKSDNIF